MGLLLRAVDVAGPLRWRWLLTDAETGAPLADHDVDLAAESDAVARFRDLYRYARQFAVPDRRVGDGARIVAEAGAWAGVASATAAAAGPVPSPACPATSLATPGLFGAGAVSRRIVVPRGRPVMDPAEQKMAFFPAEPARFVGRAEPMAKACAALAAGSGRTAVLLHGMAGAGKTACAIELAYRHQDSFAALAFWQAPTRDDEWETALPELASRLDIQLADYGFTMASHITTEAALRAFLPRLRSVMADAGVLLVLDNLETLLTLWRRLERPGEPADPKPVLAVLASAALVEVELVPAADTRSEHGTGDSPSAGREHLDAMTLRMHPGVAAAIRATAAPGVREAVDVQLAGFWRAVSGWAREREGGEDSALVVRAGLAATPYLLRRGDWNTAAFLLQQVTVRDESPGVMQTVLPPLRRIAAASGVPAAAGVLAGVLMQLDPAEAERLLRGARDAAAGAGDYRTASAAGGQLCNLLMQAGRLEEALALAGQLPELSRRAGLGPWTQLGDEGQRLQVLGRMGDHAQVVAEVDRLRAAMAAMPGRRGPGEAVDPWNVREVILGTGYASALALGEWTRCLELNAEVAASKRARGAGEHEVTRTLFNDAPPLIRLGRLEEAGRLLAALQPDTAQVEEALIEVLRTAAALAAAPAAGAPQAQPKP